MFLYCTIAIFNDNFDHIQIKSGRENLPEPQDQELDMLDTLPDADDDSRLACQLRLTNENTGLSIKIKGALQ